MSNNLKRTVIYTFSLAALLLFALNFMGGTDSGILSKLDKMEIIQHAYAEDDGPQNTGPAEDETCGKNFCNFTEKWCKSENEYSCTERFCPDHGS